MPLWVIHHLDKPASFELRAEVRPSHLEYLANFEVLAGGPLLDDESRMCGSCIILDLADRHAAEQFVENDPYTVAGLFATSSMNEIKMVTWPTSQ